MRENCLYGWIYLMINIRITNCYIRATSVILKHVRVITETEPFLSFFRSAWYLALTCVSWRAYPESLNNKKNYSDQKENGHAQRRRKGYHAVRDIQEIVITVAHYPRMKRKTSSKKVSVSWTEQRDSETLSTRVIRKFGRTRAIPHARSVEFPADRFQQRAVGRGAFVDNIEANGPKSP